MNNIKTTTGCLGVVLAGGLSSRMGKNKASLLRNGIDMLSFSQQLLTDAGVNQVIVSGDQYQVNDIVTQAGPVGGIYSVIQRYQPQSLLILPVDLPLMTAAALQKLKLIGELSNKACFYQDHQIPLYLPNSAYLEMFLQQAFSASVLQQSKQQALMNKSGKEKRGPSMKALLKQVPHQALSLADTAEKNTKTNILFNTNTPEQWQQAQKQFS